MARRGANDDERRELRARILSLEARVRTLERRLKPAVAKASAPPARRTGTRPTCPGCLLELPGKPGAACVWCGFRFDAVAPIPPRSKRRKRL